MAQKTKKADRFFLTLIFLILGSGVFMFFSASLGILARDEKVFYPVLFKQLVLGLGVGLLLMYFASKLDYKILRKNSLYILIFALILTSAVFIPGLGMSHGGAERWISLGFVSFQPAEFLKFAFIIYFAAWLSSVKNKIDNPKYGILPLMIILAICGAVLLNQPDTKSFLLMSATGAIMLFLSGAPFKHLGVLALILGVFLTLLVSFTPYLKERIKTYIDPARDSRGASYQIQQSLIAIGSGGITGRGYGQSIQKFNYLPEAQGDSIFAVIGEEFGFIGALAIIVLYVMFTLRGFKIAENAPDSFSRLLTFGIVILITAQSFMHIAAVIGVFPLTGVPLPMVSHGGTSLMIYLVAMGILIQISRISAKNT